MFYKYLFFKEQHENFDGIFFMFLWMLGGLSFILGRMRTKTFCFKAYLVNMLR